MYRHPFKTVDRVAVRICLSAARDLMNSGARKCARSHGVPGANKMAEGEQENRLPKEVKCPNGANN